MKANLPKYKTRLLLFISILMLPLNTKAQDSLTHTIQKVSLKTQFFQIKDAFNYGLVFNGLNLAGRYSLEKKTENKTFIYSPEFSFGGNFNKGVGMAWGFTPIDFFMGWNITVEDEKPIIVGAYVLSDYNWQLYPELQSGHMFWFTTIEAGPQVIFSIPIKDRAIKTTLSNSLVGFTSRPQPATETYYYSLTFSDFVTNAHSNLQFGSFNLFNHTHLEVELLNRKKKRLSVAYEFEYFGYYNEPKLSYLSHSLNLNWKIGTL